MHMRICLFTFIAIYCILILFGCSFVFCAPVKADHGARSTLEVNQHVDNVLFHTGSNVFPQISPETISDLSVAGLLNSEHFITEGDILIQLDRNSVDDIWPTAADGDVLLPYAIAPELASKIDDIEAAMEMISTKSCITFQEREDEEHYLSFKPHYGCASYVGFIGGEQPIFMSPYCTVGNICHEMLHALGFHHEHSRMDRDKHIKILFENIIKGKENNFKKVEGNTLGLPYDLGSILHYGSLYFSSSSKPTIVPQNSDQEIGQRTHLSELDVQRLRRLYKCAKSKRKLQGIGGHWYNLYDRSDNTSVTPGTTKNQSMIVTPSFSELSGIDTDGH